MSDPRISAIRQMQKMTEIAKSNKPIKNKQEEVSFQDMMKKYLNEANDLQIKADEDIKKIISGEEIDAHEVMMAVEKANISFDLVMEIRNKMLEAYKQVVKTQI